MVGAAAQQVEIPLRSIITQKRERIQNHVEVHCRSQRNDVRDVTVEVNGMMCGMCEAHINDAVRKACPVKKVHSSRAKCQTVVLSEAELDPETIAAAIRSTGYEVGAIQKEPYQKRGFFGL